MRPSRTRFFILMLLFIVTAINYVDRANLAVAGTEIQNDLGLTATQLGLLFSMLTWFYTASQIPVGYVLDRIGSRFLYGSAIILWSIFTFMMGFSSHHLFATTTASFAVLLVCRALIGVAESPSFPSNAKIIATWFPSQERARATATFASAQYIGLALLIPVLSFIVKNYGWEMSFYAAGGVGILFGIYWLIYYRDPQHSKSVNQAELDYIKEGGGYGSNNQATVNKKISLNDIKFFLSKKTIWGVFIGHWAASSTLGFFLTWFIIYLEKGLHLSSGNISTMIPYIMAMLGVLCGGTLSDIILKKTKSKTLARKVPIMLGLLSTITIFLVNFFEGSPTIAIAIMSISFFANAFSNLGWVVWSDIIPRNYLGTMGGILNVIGGTSGIITPIVIGVILQNTQSFHYVMWYNAAVALMGLLAYIFLVDKIEVIVPPKKENLDIIQDNTITASK